MSVLIQLFFTEFDSVDNYLRLRNINYSILRMFVMTDLMRLKKSSLSGACWASKLRVYSLVLT